MYLPTSVAELLEWQSFIDRRISAREASVYWKIHACRKHFLINGFPSRVDNQPLNWKQFQVREFSGIYEHRGLKFHSIMTNSSKILNWSRVGYCRPVYYYRFYLYTSQAGTHKKGKYQHNRTETIYITLKTKYMYSNHSSQISLIISEILL